MEDGIKSGFSSSINRFQTDVISSRVRKVFSLSVEISSVKLVCRRGNARCNLAFKKLNLAVVKIMLNFSDPVFAPINCFKLK